LEVKDLKSKTTEDIISIGSFMKVLVLNHYVLVRKIFSLVKTPMVPPKNLGPDLAGKLINETSYRGMIGSLMYLTTTRPDIQFSIILCARYQSNPKKSHLTTVKKNP
ncbi:hypothetical protein Tco_1084783, partial [Tanacetum coccineum]